MDQLWREIVARANIRANLWTYGQQDFEELLGGYRRRIARSRTWVETRQPLEFPAPWPEDIDPIITIRPNAESEVNEIALNELFEKVELRFYLGSGREFRPTFGNALGRPEAFELWHKFPEYMRALLYHREGVPPVFPMPGLMLAACEAHFQEVLQAVLAFVVELKRAVPPPTPY